MGHDLIEERLLSPWPRERTYDRPLLELDHRPQPLRVTVRARGKSRVGWSGALVALALVVVATTGIVGS